MFEIMRAEDGSVIIGGKLDAAHADQAKQLLDTLTGFCTLDCKDLSYVSSIGLGILAMTQQRLLKNGGGLKFANLNDHIRNIFRIASLDKIFDIE
jgi:anti-anti-sigma factor